MNTNVLYWGDNLPILRNKDYFPDVSVDLVYLAPPFNSNANYNVLFREATGAPATAQAEAFKDTWHWADAQDTWADLHTPPPSEWWTPWKHSRKSLFSRKDGMPTTT